MGANNIHTSGIGRYSIQLVVSLVVSAFFITTSSAQINNADFRVGVTSQDLGPCGGSNNSFTFLNILSKTSDNNSFLIVFDLPDGVSYIPGSAEIREQQGSGDFVLTVDDSNPNAPEFSLQRPTNANWQTSDRVRFRFRKSGDCDAVQFSYSGGLFKDAHSITYTNALGPQAESDNDPTINSYNFLSPLLSTLNYGNTVAQLGENVTKTIEINNSGNGTLERFSYTVTVDEDLDDVYALSFNGTILTPISSVGGVYTYTIDLNSAPFLGNVGNGDNLFEDSENILLEETFTVEACGTHTISHQAEWGCSIAEICQITAPVSGVVNVSTALPNLVVSEINNFGNTDLTSTATYQARIANTSPSAPAYDVVINTGFGQNNSVQTTSTQNGLFGNDRPNVSKIIDNFRFATTGTAIPVTQLPNTQFAGVGAGSYIIPPSLLQNIDPDGAGVGLDDLDGDGYFDDLPAGAAIDILFDFDFDLLSPSTCTEEEKRFIQYNFLRTHAYGFNQCGTEVLSNQSYFSNSYFTGRTSNTTAPTDIFDGQAFNVAIQSGLQVGGRDRPLCNGQPFFTPDPSSSWTVTLNVPAGVGLAATAGPEYTQIGNTITYSTTDLNSINQDYWNENIPFPLEYSCGSGASGPLQINYTTRYESQCVSEDVHCGVIQMNAVCPSSCDGPVIQNFDAQRFTPGWTDSSMATLVSLNATDHNLDTYAARDEMLLTASSSIFNISVDNLYFDLTYSVPTNGGGSDIISYLQDADSNIEINAGPNTLVGTPVFITDSPGNYRLRFNLSDANGVGIPYNPGDVIDMQLKFVFNDNFNTAVLFDLSNFRGEFFYFNGLGNKTSCLSLGDQVSYVKASIQTLFSQATANACNSVLANTRLQFQTGNIGDIFPNEYRPVYLWQSTEFDIPVGATFENDVTSNGFSGNPNSTNGGILFSQSGNTITATPGTTFENWDWNGDRYPEIRFRISGGPTTPDTSTYDYRAQFVEYAYSNYAETNSLTRTNRFNYNAPEFMLSSPNPIVTGSEALASFELDICSTSVTDVDYNWIQIDHGPGFVVTEVVEMVGASENNLIFLQDLDHTWVELGAFASGSGICKSIRFSGTYSSCGNLDITVENSWDCDAYPLNTTQYETATYFNAQPLRLETQEATLQVQLIDQPTTSVDICTDFNIGLELRNADAGNLIDPYVTFDIPGDVAGVLINGIQVEYPRGSGDIQTVSSSLIGNQVNVNIMGHTAIAAEQGIKGATNALTLDEQIAIINLNLNLRCDFTSNTAITYTAYGNNTCGTPAEGNGVRLSTDPLVLNGAEASYSTATTITVANGGIFQGCGPQRIEVRTIVIDNGPTSSNDVARIVLPDGLRFDTSSLTSSSAFTMSNPVVSIVGNHEEIDIQMPDGAANGDIILYAFDVYAKDEPNTCTPSADLFINNFEISSVLSCGGVSCSASETAVGTAGTTVQIEKSNLASNGTASALYGQLANGDTQYELNFEILETNGIDLPTGAVYQVYCADNVGTRVGNAIYTGTLDQDLSGNGTMTENVTFAAASFCGDDSNLLVVFDPAATNCHCDPLSILVTSQERIADIELNMTADNLTVNSGEAVTFTIEVANNGPFDAGNIDIVSIIPNGFNFVSVQNGGTRTADTLQWSIPSLTSGETTVLGFVLVPNGPTGIQGEYIVVSEVRASDATDPDSTPNNYDATRPLEDDEALLEITVVAVTDISVVKTADRAESFVGDSMIFTITITNEGFDSATNIGVEDILPDGFELTTAVASVGNYDALTGVWAIPALESGESTILEMTVTVRDGSSYTNVASLAYVDPVDNNANNDRSEVTISVTQSECLTIYNEFSPNADGINDVFYIECIDEYPNNLLQIFNRWGTKVFERRNYSNDWSGISEAKTTIQTEEKLPVGTYFYLLELGDGNPMKSGWLYISK